MVERVELDGSFGEGGGQILRTSLTLSLLTGRPFRIFNIRGRRVRGGLRAQHLQCAKAAAQISGASIEGDTVGSSELLFEPGEVKPCKLTFEIGTAGSTSLVLQTIALPLAFASGPSEVTITGGTHVPWSPCTHYLIMEWAALLETMGVKVDVELISAGYYPRGGGEIRAAIHPAGTIAPLCCTERGELQSLTGLSMVSNLDAKVAERQSRRAQKRLADIDLTPDLRVMQIHSIGVGTAIMLLAKFDGGRCCYVGLGERHKKAERVAEDATKQMLRFFATDATLDEYAADQMLLPAALAAGTSEYRTPVVTQHLLTNAEVVRRFLPAEVSIDGTEGGPGTVKVVGAPLSRD